MFGRPQLFRLRPSRFRCTALVCRFGVRHGAPCALGSRCVRGGNRAIQRSFKRITPMRDERTGVAVMRDCLKPCAWRTNKPRHRRRRCRRGSLRSSRRSCHQGPARRLMPLHPSPRDRRQHRSMWRRQAALRPQVLRRDQWRDRLAPPPGLRELPPDQRPVPRDQQGLSLRVRSDRLRVQAGPCSPTPVGLRRAQARR